jgi:hypothetical protein
VAPTRVILFVFTQIAAGSSEGGDREWLSCKRNKIFPLRMSVPCRRCNKFISEGKYRTECLKGTSREIFSCNLGTT